MSKVPEGTTANILLIPDEVQTLAQTLTTTNEFLVVDEQAACGALLQPLFFCCTTRGLLSLQIHALKIILTRMVIRFNKLGSGVGGVLINDRLG